VTYAETIQFLYGLQMFGANFGLENTRRLAALVGNPQDKLRFIHVAGTNGKGSTCAMLESIYNTAGLRVGLFTSPHLVSFRERVQVNRQLIPEAGVVRLVDELRSVNRENDATLFEFATVMALMFFAGQKCDLVIWETGLGGRLDATNIVTPLASVITNIAFDHTQWLGDTLEKIAAEKAGIIKPGVPVVAAAAQPEVLAVIEKFAREKNAPLTTVPVGGISPLAGFSGLTRGAATLPLAGEHQKQNAALALATVEVLQKQIPVAEDILRTGLAKVRWPGRLQWIQKPDGQKILLDGAHNVAGVEALRSALAGGAPVSGPAGFPDPSQPYGTVPGSPALIVGFLGDKDWRLMCKILAPMAAKIFAVPVASGRTAGANELAAVFREANPAASVTVCRDLSAAFNAGKDEPFVVVTGSLYLIGEALELLGHSPAGAGERELNEWSAPDSCDKGAAS
jgi:dihydrofolate synthase/folylpolyglutamate synthase